MSDQSMLERRLRWIMICRRGREMGAWGAGIYENDDAADFVAEVISGKDLSRIVEVLNAVRAEDGYLEAPVASEALVAADIIARLRGSEGVSSAYNEGLDAWVTRVKVTPDDALRDRAIEAVKRVRTEPSELLELWFEGDASEWLAVLDDLEQRLATSTTTKPPSFWRRVFKAD